jgi:hypothetical protein
VKRLLAMVALAAALAVYLWFLWPAGAHDWFPANCCSGFDCKVIAADQVQTTRQGFAIPGNPEIVPYSSSKIRQTPPEGEGNYALCTTGGRPDGAVICLYIPTWGS